jgi:hypothetical protein
MEVVFSMLFCRPFITRSLLGGAGGFSLPGVLVGVGLLGVSAVVISNTVVDARRSQQRADIKLSSNKLQQAILDAVTGRIKEFMLDNCSGARWGGAGSTEVEKAFSRINIPLSGTSSGGASPALRFYKVAGDIPTSFSCSTPVGPALMNSSDPNSGQYLRFCMNIDPTGHSSVSQRLLELLVVPVNLASDSAITCAKARGPGAGVKVTWQMHNKINNAKVKGSGSTVQVLKESGTFLISAETESYTGTCNIAPTRQGTTNQCTVNVGGLGRRPPTLIKNGAVAAGITWARITSPNNDAFTTTTICETNQPTNFIAQSADGGSHCSAEVKPTYTLTTSVSPAGSGSITRSPDATTYTHGSTVTLTATPAAGGLFKGWGGACSGTANTCSVTMDGNKSVTANFSVECTGWISVPGRANPYFAGSGSNSSIYYSGKGTDYFSSEKPVQFIPNNASCLEGGAKIYFNVSGSVHHGGSGSNADGASRIEWHQRGSHFGKSDMRAPLNSLVGVFLGPSLPNVAPGSLDFGNSSARNYLSLSPVLGQIFFIGDGLTSLGQKQIIVVPPGTTRLYLAVWDVYEWKNNSGSFGVKFFVE